MLFLYVAKYDLGSDKLSWPAVSLSDMQGHPNCIKGGSWPFYSHSLEVSSLRSHAVACCGVYFDGFP